MYDALEELSDLSLALQKADINLSVAHRLISRQVEVFQARMCNDTHRYKEAGEAASLGLFKGVEVRTASGK